MLRRHPLDRPVSAALATGWAALACGGGGGGALRLHPDYGPFAATDGTARGAASLGTLIADGQETWLVEAEHLPLPAGLFHTETALHQMVADTALVAPNAVGVRPLGDEDAAEMRALAALAAPGPFRSRTHRIGAFIGLHADGRLVAMAGTRMRMPGFVEVSGVCTHPEARGQGHAARLSRLVAARLQGQGAVPFLHAYPGNVTAVSLYKALGFSLRREMLLITLNGATQTQKSHPG